MKEIAIYSSVVSIDENITSKEMKEGNLASLLSKNNTISFEEKKQIIDAFEKNGIAIKEILIPDGYVGMKNERNKKQLYEELTMEI